MRSEEIKHLLVKELNIQGAIKKHTYNIIIPHISIHFPVDNPEFLYAIAEENTLTNGVIYLVCWIKLIHRHDPN